ncbi:MAG: DUF3298 domain-containing protein [Aminipila sp.]
MKKNEEFLTLKEEYNQVKIPDQLEQIVQESIRNAEADVVRTMGNDEIAKRRTRMKKQIGGIAAAMVIGIGAFGIGVNTSPAFADTMADIPVLSSLAKVFTAEQIHEETDSYITDMKIPGIEGLKDKKLQSEINELVYKQVTAAVAETQTMMEDYKKAYLETGGKEEEYVTREIDVDYSVQCLTEDILSFSVYKTETLASAYFDMFYYNYDLKTGKPITLEGLLGSDYKEVANKQIKEQIAERSKVEGNFYWNGEEGIDGFESITDNQQFYVNKKGNPVIIFNKYEIAPGYMGIQEFEIVK